MKALTIKSARKLLEEAKKVSKNSYSPYSKYPVGAAVLTEDNKIFKGTNVENASYGLSLCAERIAMGNFISHSKKCIRAIAVYSPVSDATPCGACRQFIREFGSEIDVVYMEKKKIVIKKIAELLPSSFGKQNLS